MIVLSPCFTRPKGPKRPVLSTVHYQPLPFHPLIQVYRVNIVMPESLGCMTTLFVCFGFNIENQELHLNIKIIVVFQGHY